MRVLVTGGAGYIGTHTMLSLLADGHDVHVIDNFYNSSAKALERVQRLSNRDFGFEEIDVRDASALAKAVTAFRPDAVIHFAGLKAVGESEEKPVDYYAVNVTGTVNLLAAMDQAGCKRIVFSSSATVYGEPQYLPYDEAHPLAPTSVYGRTKMLGEQIITDWQRATPGTCGVLLRYFNPVGAHDSGQIGEDPSDIPNNLMPFIAQVAVGRRDKLMVFGNDYDTVDGTGVRDYIHVDDLARAHSAAVTFAETCTDLEVFNIGAGQGYSVLQMVDAFGRACGKDIPYAFAPRRAGDIAEFYANPAKANAALNWRTERDIDDMCATTWNWQHQNPLGYDG